VLLGIVACVVAFSCAKTSDALAAPGVPADPQTLYFEDFQNGAGVTELERYSSSTGASYSADSYWLNQSRCNGFVLSFADPYPGSSYCNTFAANWDTIRGMSNVLGLLNSPQNAATNRAVASYSSGGTDNATPFVPDAPLSPMVEFESTGQLRMPSAGRFVTFSVDAAALNCGNPPRLRFYLRDDAGTRIPASSSAINPCSDPRRRSATVAGRSYLYGSFPANGSVLLMGSSLGIVMVNESPHSNGNDHAFDNIRVLDVTPALDKSFSPAVVDAGQTSTLTFTITNTSELAAKAGWSFTDTLPAGLVVANPSGASTTCTNGIVTAAAGSGSIAVSGDLVADQVSCTVSVTVTSPMAGRYVNGPGNVTTTGLNAPADATVQFLAADLAIVKRALSARPVPGRDLTYEVTVSNLGPGLARDIRVSDSLPDGLSFVSASSGCVFASGMVRCTAASLAAGRSITFEVVTRVARSVTGRIVNTATVESATSDPDPSNNRWTESVPPGPEADLSVAKVPSVDSVAVGGQLFYTLVVRNDGPSDAQDVVVSDVAGGGLTLLSASASQGGSCSVTASRVVCRLGAVAVGGTAQVLVSARVDQAGELVNSATVDSPTPDPDPADDRDTRSVIGVPGPLPQPANLEVVKTANRRAVLGSGTITYTLRVSNTGPGAASGVQVIDTPSLPVRIRSVRSSVGRCTMTVPIRCDLGTLAAGASATIRVVAQPAAPGLLRNSASVTGDLPDPRTDDNIDGTTTKVQGLLKVTKVASSKTVRAGGTISYKIRVTNASTFALSSVRVCDDLPSGLVFASSTPKSKLVRGRRCWTTRALGANRSMTFTLKARVLRGTHGRKVNVATATAPNARGARSRAAAGTAVISVRRVAARGGGVTG